LFFASSSYNLNEIAAAMQEAFGDIPTFGCTTAGELVTGAMLANSVSAMLLTNDVIAELGIEIVQGLRGDATVWGGIIAVLTGLILYAYLPQKKPSLRFTEDEQNILLTLESAR
jgi:hypothetical protein